MNLEDSCSQTTNHPLWERRLSNLALVLLSILGLAVFSFSWFRSAISANEDVKLAVASQTGGESKPEAAGPAEAIFAGGCFWCMEPPFDRLNGVLDTVAGYTGGRTENPTYEQVKTGRTGHLESLRVTYDPKQLAYHDLLEVFWRNVDPTQKNGQFCDDGPQYRSAIFVRDQQERKLAEESKQAIETKLNRSVHTEILDAETFFQAEDYHQNYYQKNPVKYKFYRWKCGRDARLQALWGKSAH